MAAKEIIVLNKSFNFAHILISDVCNKYDLFSESLVTQKNLLHILICGNIMVLEIKKYLYVF